MSGPTNGRTRPLIEMRSRIKKAVLVCADKPALAELEETEVDGAERESGGNKVGNHQQAKT